uniref:Uncharacterized protein n=1 Tax=Rhipicephalus pulchellus TaxID=72859 RepID=L7LVL2_RHIPC
MISAIAYVCLSPAFFSLTFLLGIIAYMVSIFLAGEVLSLYNAISSSVSCLTNVHIFCCCCFLLLLLLLLLLFICFFLGNIVL